MTSLGMISSLPKLVQAGPPLALSVLLDGRVVGSILSSEVEKVVAHLRKLKVSATSVVCLPIFFFAGSAPKISLHDFYRCRTADS